MDRYHTVHAPVLHVDRGPFQVDPSTSGVGDLAAGGVLLRVTPERNPSRALRLDFASRVPGELRVDVFDLAGRHVASARRVIGAGESGTLAWPAVRVAGLYLYRAQVKGAAVNGKLALLP